MNSVVEGRKESATESNLGLLKRFNRRVQGIGLVRKVRANQYKQRPLSVYKQKKRALKRLEKIGQIERLRKLGKLPDARQTKFR